MKYYDHHIGDYATAIQYRSWDDDMAYTRMLRWYYANETPLPADPEDVMASIGANSEAQRAAVTAVLRIFFRLEADGYHNDKCDEVIAKYQAGEPEREAKKKNEETRLEKHRRERSDLFAVLNAAGQHLPYNTHMGELRKAVETLRVAGFVSSGSNSVSGGVSGEDKFPSESSKPETPATALATLATATHKPLTNNQYPVSLEDQDAGASLSTSAKPTIAELQKSIDGIPSGLKGAYKPPDCPHAKILALWAEMRPESVQHTSWEGTRKSWLKARWKAEACKEKWGDEAAGLYWFKRFFFYLGKSPFLMGEVPPSPGHKQFELELAWVVNATNWAKIRDGKYHQKKEA